MRELLMDQEQSKKKFDDKLKKFSDALQEFQKVHPGWTDFLYNRF